MHQSESMPHLDYRDLDRVVELLDEVSDPVDDLAMPERKRRFAVGLARLVDADVYIWSTTVVNHETPGDFMTTCVIRWRLAIVRGARTRLRGLNLD